MSREPLTDAQIEELVRRHELRVYQTALAVLKNHAEAQDVAQEAFVRAFLKR